MDVQLKEVSKKQDQEQIARANVMQKQIVGLPVSNYIASTYYTDMHSMVRTYVCMYICINTGEPTLEEQAQLLIAALDLGSLPVSVPNAGLPNIPSTLTIARNISHISRRSISAICGTPSTEICTPSK